MNFNSSYPIKTDPFQINKRQISGFMEMFIIIDLIVIPIFIISDKILELPVNNVIKFFLLCVECSLILMKDVIDGGSLIKRKLGLRIVDVATQKTATPLKTVLRNTTILIFLPIELVFCVLSPERRIGDYLAKTKLVEVEGVIIKNLLVGYKCKWKQNEGIKMLLINIVVISMVMLVYYYIFTIF